MVKLAISETAIKMEPTYQGGPSATGFVLISCPLLHQAQVAVGGTVFGRLQPVQREKQRRRNAVCVCASLPLMLWRIQADLSQNS